MPLAASVVPSPFAAGKGEVSSSAHGPVTAFASAVSSSGIDVVEPFALSWLNAELAAHAVACTSAAHAPIPGPDSAPAALVGHSRAAWAALVARLAAAGAAAAPSSPDPLADAVAAAIADAAAATGGRVVWTGPGPRAAAADPAAAAADPLPAAALAAARAGWPGGPGTAAPHLTPRLGPWVELAAVVVWPAAAPHAAPRPPCPPRPAAPSTADQCHARLAARTASLLLERAASGSPPGTPRRTSPPPESTTSALRAMAEARDCAWPGNPFAYPPALVAFIYGPDPCAALQAAVDEARAAAAAAVDAAAAVRAWSGGGGAAAAAAARRLSSSSSSPPPSALAAAPPPASGTPPQGTPGRRRLTVRVASGGAD